MEKICKIKNLQKREHPACGDPSHVNSNKKAEGYEMIRLDFNSKSYLFPKLVQNRFRIGKSINRGSFGSVYECLDKHTNTDLVIKIVSEPQT
jgi:serine/threonine protein kinase